MTVQGEDKNHTDSVSDMYVGDLYVFSCSH